MHAPHYLAVQVQVAAAACVQTEFAAIIVHNYEYARGNPTFKCKF